MVASKSISIADRDREKTPDEDYDLLIEDILSEFGILENSFEEGDEEYDYDDDVPLLNNVNQDLEVSYESSSNIPGTQIIIAIFTGSSYSSIPYRCHERSTKNG